MPMSDCHATAHFLATQSNSLLARIDVDSLTCIVRQAVPQISRACRAFQDVSWWRLRHARQVTRTRVLRQSLTHMLSQYEPLMKLVPWMKVLRAAPVHSFVERKHFLDGTCGQMYILLLALQFLRPVHVILRSGQHIPPMGAPPPNKVWDLQCGGFILPHGRRPLPWVRGRGLVRDVHWCRSQFVTAICADMDVSIIFPSDVVLTVLYLHVLTGRDIFMELRGAECLNAFPRIADLTVTAFESCPPCA